MQLKEFELDLPYVVNEERINKILKEQNIEKENVIKVDYENNWKDKRKSFRLDTRCMTAMFERLFEGIENVEFWKILIECVPSVNDTHSKNIGGVIFKQIEFNYEDFVKYNNEIKKQISLETLIRGIKDICFEKNITFTPFEKVYNEIIKQDYKNNWQYGKSVKNKNKIYGAEILCEHDVEKIDIFISIKNKNSEEILRKKIISELPDEYAYSKHLGKIKWQTNEIVEFYNKKGILIFTHVI